MVKPGKEEHRIARKLFQQTKFLDDQDIQQPYIIKSIVVYHEPLFSFRHDHLICPLVIS